MSIDSRELVSALRGRQVPLLLAYLVLGRDRDVGREELSIALWPERAPRSQDAALRTLLSRLRSALGTEVLQGREQLTLDLPEPVWIDLEAASDGLERAREALDAGDPKHAWALAQVPLNVAARGLMPGFDAHWLERPRQDLAELRLGALEVVARAGLMLGGAQLQSAQRAARTLIEAEPYRESGYTLLMQALAAGGDLAEGLRVFERLRQLLRDELGTAPSPETIATHERLLHPPRRSTRPAPRGELRIALPAELGARPRSELIGRELELKQLERLWNAIQAPGSGELPAGRVGLVAGEPGVGKTRLMAELARRVHSQGAVVLAGRSTQETLAPYQPFLEALRHYVALAPVEALEVTAREHGAELARLLPELRRRLPDLAAPESAAPELERYRLFEAVAGLLTEIAAAAPVLLIFDDLHWADRPTLLLLLHLARVPPSARVSILAAYRSSGAESLDGTLSELRHEQLVTELQLGGLEPQETAELVRGRTRKLPSLALTRALHARTEGNPLFVLQIVRRLEQAGIDIARAGPAELRSLGLPEDLKRLIAQRLAGLGSVTGDWLRAAAVIGRDFDASLPERVSLLSEDDSIAALEESLKAGVVVPRLGNPGRAATGYAYSFSHPLIRETLYEDMSPPRRARLHRRAAEALEQNSGRADEQLSMLAQQFARTDDPRDADKAIRYARMASERATAMLAYEEAAEHYARALDVLDRFKPGDTRLRLELLLALGESYVLSGDRPLAPGPLREAAEIAIQLSDADSLARAAVAASRRYVQEPGIVDEQLIALLERALEMTASQMTTLRVRLLARMCGALYYSDQRDRMASLSAEATAIAKQLGDPEALALAAAARRRAFWTPAHLDQRLADSGELLRFAREAADLELTLQGHAWLVVDLLEQGELDAVDAQIEAFAAGVEQVRQPLYAWQAAVWRAMRALLSGRLDEAELLSERAFQIGARAEAVTASQYYAIQLLSIRRAQGREGELESGLRQLLEQYPNRVAYRAALGTLLSETGQLADAARELEPLATAGFSPIPVDGDWMITVTLLADAYSDLGDVERARRLYELLVPFERANVVIALGAVCEGAVSRTLGRLAAVIGRTDESTRHFEDALARNDRLGAPIWLARTQLDYAQAIGDRADLVEAATLAAREHGLGGLARRAASL